MPKIKRYGIIVSIALIVFLFIFNFTFGRHKSIITTFYLAITGTQQNKQHKKQQGKQRICVIIDDSGIPIVDYGGTIRKQRNPVTISQRAIFYEDKYKKTNDEKYKQLFLNCADWLVNNAIKYDNYAIWEYNFPWDIYNMTPPWRSAMAQGQGIRVLIRADNLTGNKKYLDLAKASLNSFYVEVRNGGVTYKENDNEWWYEEYADESGSNSRVLNGMIYALFGIHEYYEQTGDENAKLLFDKGTAALKKHLADYDTGSWTYYDALGHLASKNYHKIHVAQLSKLYKLTGDVTFREYYERWKGYNLIKNNKE